MGGYVEQNQWKPTVRRGPIAAEYTSPGPASVNLSSSFGIGSADSTKRSSPSYTIVGRTPIPMDRTQKPGPGAHSPEKVLDALNTPPRYSFGIKHSPYVGHLPGELKRCPTYEILNEPSSTHKTQQKSTHTSTRTMVHYETGPDGRKTKTTTTITKMSDNKGGPGTTNIKRIQSGTDGKEVVLYDGPGSDRDIDRMMTPTGNAALKNSRTVQTRQVVNHYTTAQVSNNEVKSSHVAESYTSDTKPSSYNYTP